MRKLLAALKPIVATLRECCALQVIEPKYAFRRITLFGRAKYMTGRHWSDDSQPEYYMAYWVQTPFLEWGEQDYGRRYGWNRLVLQWHGKHGFVPTWISLEYLS